MDTGSDYIKMCEKFLNVIWIETGRDYEIPTIGMSGDPRIWWWEHRPYWFDGKQLNRLFTQDQLQRMVESISVFELMRDFNEFNDFDGKKYPDSHPYTFSLNSMEQLWLAFVMSEKFGKVWSGNEWQKKK